MLHNFCMHVRLTEGEMWVSCCSGGQRKRVNIGLELVARPSVLFMVRYCLSYMQNILNMMLAQNACHKIHIFVTQDEPTSGLDATAATDILASLRRCALTTNQAPCTNAGHKVLRMRPAKP